MQVDLLLTKLRTIGGARDVPARSGVRRARPVVDWFARYEAERDAQDEALAAMARA